jgi:deazaflavin-dependent oxidoreductase (nitroreductase family)
MRGVRRSPSPDHGATARASRPRARGRLRLAWRLPSWAYRLGLGWLLGDRFLLLTHTGRRTGRRRQTVVEVLRHDRASGTYVVCSGRGPQAQWLRDVGQNPEVTVIAGRGEQPARAELLSVDAGAVELVDFARRHPLAFRAISRRLAGLRRAGTPDVYRELAWSIPVVTLRAKGSGVRGGRSAPSRGVRARFAGVIASHARTKAAGLVGSRGLVATTV